VTRYSEVTPVLASTYQFNPFAADMAGLRLNEPGKVLALPNGGEHRVGPPDGYVICAGIGQVTVGSYGYSYGGYNAPAPVKANSGYTDRGASRRLPGPVVEDSPGCNLRPDPVVEATDAASLIRTLNDFRAYAGDPSFREMERGCGRLRSHSTLYRVLTGDRMPTQVEVKAVILGCGGTEEDVSRYVSAWRQIRLPDREPAQLAPPVRAVVNFAKAKKAS
jgi:hypothetical protein